MTRHTESCRARKRGYEHEDEYKQEFKKEKKIKEEKER